VRIILLFLAPLALVLLSSMINMYSSIFILTLFCMLPIALIKARYFFKDFELFHRAFLLMAFQFLILNAIVFVLGMEGQKTIMIISSNLILAMAIIAWFLASRDKTDKSKALNIRLSRNLYLAFNISMSLVLSNIFH
jgi:hypothetical protein